MRPCQSRSLSQTVRPAATLKSATLAPSSIASCHPLPRSSTLCHALPPLATLCHALPHYWPPSVLPPLTTIFHPLPPSATLCHALHPLPPISPFPTPNIDHRLTTPHHACTPWPLLDHSVATPAKAISSLIDLKDRNTSAVSLLGAECIGNRKWDDRRTGGKNAHTNEEITHAHLSPRYCT
jgi:hypothetical protein